MFKFLFACTLIACGAVLMAGPVLAADPVNEQTHDGFVVSVDGDKLTMADKDGQNAHTHVIGADATITLNGEASELINLQKGDAIKVTTDNDGKVTAVAATREKA